ncbi:hypothetical protein [Paenibacillus terrigena]|uniref:hypothetical protein n=1 Tax=Paenibacillus terrigena TaxID=369333 RepID=UPI0028D343CE|nr:hypothetical protein [Paenibacillus terrigena]
MEVVPLKKISLFLYIMLSIILVSGCASKMTEGSGDWAYPFVIWQDDIFEVLEEEIDADQIDQEIGEVKRYSDTEGIYGNGFSNKLLVGTKLYRVKNIDISDFIAVRIGEIYKKARDKGRYRG